MLTYNELLETLKDKGFVLDETIIKDPNNCWWLKTNQLDYINTKKDGIIFFRYDGECDADSAYERAYNVWYHNNYYNNKHQSEPRRKDFKHGPRASIQLLMPDLKLTPADITYLTTKRKKDLWTDFYSTTYSGFEIYLLKDLTKEKLIELFDKQKKLYNIINGLHKNEEMKTILDRIKTLRTQIKNDKKSIDDLNNKLATWYEKIRAIEND